MENDDGWKSVPQRKIEEKVERKDRRNDQPKRRKSSIGQRIVPFNGVTKPRSLDQLTLGNTSTLTFRGKSVDARVLKVYDGDTITLGYFLNHNTPLRINCRCFGYDAPELRSTDPELKAKAVAARDYLAKLLLGRVIPVILGDTDRYGRTLISIFIERPNEKPEPLSDHMCRMGYGKPYLGVGKKPWGV